MKSSTAFRVAIYVRISEDRERDEEGVDRQREHCEARAERESWSVVRVFTDNDLGASTRSRKPRPEYAQMLAAAERGEIDVILSYSNSRLTRRPRELEDLVDLHLQTGVLLRTIVSGDDDLSKTEGRMVARIKASVDAAEAEKIADRVADAARQRAARGRAHGGRRPFGWNLDGTLHAVEGPALQAGIQDVTNGDSIRSVARAWDAAGLPTVTGRPWVSNLTNARQVLVRWRNAGVRVHRGQPLLDGEPFCAPVCSREVLEELRARLAARKRRTNGGAVALSALLGGIALCDVCSQPMVKATKEVSKLRKDERVGTYRCFEGHVTIRCGLIDELVVEAAITELVSADLAAMAPTEDDRARLAYLQAELGRIEQGRRNLASALESGDLSLVDVREAQVANRARHSAVQAELESISARFAPATFVQRERSLLLESVEEEPNPETDDEIDAGTAAVIDRFESFSLNHRREIIRSLLVVRVRRGRAADRVVIEPRAHGVEMLANA